MKLAVYQGNKRRGNKPFWQSDFTLKWSALQDCLLVKTESQVEDTAFEETTRDASKFGKLIIISLKMHLNERWYYLQNRHRQCWSFRFKRGMAQRVLLRLAYLFPYCCCYCCVSSITIVIALLIIYKMTELKKSPGRKR